jgi:hypothetical protein
MLRLSGYFDVHACYVQPVIPMSDARDFVVMGAKELEPVVVKCGMMSETEANQTLRDLQDAKFASEDLYTFPRQAQVFGHKG